MLTGCYGPHLHFSRKYLHENLTNLGAPSDQQQMFPKLKQYTNKYLSKNAVVEAKILRPIRPRPGQYQGQGLMDPIARGKAKALNPRGQDQGHKFVSSRASSRPRPVLEDYTSLRITLQNMQTSSLFICECR